MIHLITGVNGAGKTSNTLDEFLRSDRWKFYQDATGAKVPRLRYVNDIPGFDHAAHDCQPIAGFDDWASVPDGSVVLLDECHRYFKSMDVRKRDYPAFDDLETVRHRGIDLLLLAQSPSMFHPVVRQLASEHVHYARPHGLGYSLRYQFSAASDLSPGAISTAVTERVRPDKSIYTKYRSTVADTQKARLPLKYYALLLLPVLVLVAGYFAVTKLRAMSNAEGLPADAAVSASQVAAMPGAGTGPRLHLPSSPGDKDSFSYTLADFAPRTPLDPSTAPIYDHLTQPSDFPRIAACYEAAAACRCFTQQATPVQIERATCSRMVKEGWFDRWQTGRRQLAIASASSHDSASLVAAAPVSRTAYEAAPAFPGADSP